MANWFTNALLAMKETNVTTNEYGNVAMPSEKAFQTPQQKYNTSYFKGLKGLNSKDRADWERQYANEIKGMSPAAKNNFFRNKIFENLYKDSPDIEDQKIYANRKSYNVRDRNKYVALKMLKEDIDAMSDLGESSFSLGKAFRDIDYGILALSSKSIDTAREQASKFLREESSVFENKYLKNISALSSEEVNEEYAKLDNLSKEIFPLYRKYAGTEEMPITDADKRSLLAKYYASVEVGGSTFAVRELNREYKDRLAENQGFLEKVWNSNIQFHASGLGEMIRGVGMVGGFIGGIFNYTLEENKDAGYWKNLLLNTIDNDITRYGDRLATTQSFDPKEQELLEKEGLSAAPIFNTEDLENSLISWNTPHELHGLYGFTVASTIMSLGASAAVKTGMKLAAWGAKALKGAEVLNKTLKGIKLARGIIRTEKILLKTIPGALGTIEGGMNAALAKNETLKKLELDIQDKYENKVNEGIEKDGLASGLNEEQIAELKSNPNIRAQYKAKYNNAIAQEQEWAKESAETGMLWDFVGQSIINGFINTGLQSTQMAPRIQNALGVNKNSINKSLNIVKDGEVFKAEAKKATRREAVRNRLRESFGEGIEEYSQDISSAFGTGYAESKMQLFVDNKYNSRGTDATVKDFLWTLYGGVENLGAGFKNAADKLTNFQSIKSGLYGFLSTAMGGPNVRMRQGANGNMVINGITWRSAVGPIFNKSERESMNKSREAMAERFNRMLQDPKVQLAFINAGGTNEWMRLYFEDIASGDEMRARTSRLGHRVSSIIAFNDLEGTDYHSAIMAHLQARANLDESRLGDPESEESKAVEEWLASPQARGQNISKEEAVKTIKTNAKEMLELMANIKNASEYIRSAFGENLDQDVEASMIFNRMFIDDAETRRNLLEKELLKFREELPFRPAGREFLRSKDSGLSDRSKKIIAKFGSEEAALKYRDSLEKDIKEQEENMKGVKRSELKDQELEVYDEARKQLAAAKLQLKELNKDLKAYDLESTVLETEEFDPTKHSRESFRETKRKKVHKVLSASEILSLDPIERAAMLDPNHRKFYSAEQQAEIDKVNNAGTNKFQNFQLKIQDLAKLENEYKWAIAEQYDILTDPTALNGYIKNARMQARMRYFKNKNEHLIELAEQGDYAGFSRELNEVYNRQDPFEIAAVEQLLTDTKYLGITTNFSQAAKDMFLNHKEGQKKFGNLYDWITENNIFKEGDSKADAFAAALDYLNGLGIDINDIEAGVEALLRTNEEGTSEFELYVQNINENRDESERITLKSLEETVQTYKEVLNQFKEFNENKRKLNEEITPSETPPEASNPPSTPSTNIEGVPEVTPTKEEEEELDLGDEGTPTIEAAAKAAEQQAKKQKEEEEKKLEKEKEELDIDSQTLEEKWETSNEGVILDAAKQAIKITSNIPYYEDSVKDEVRTILDELSKTTYENLEQLIDALNARANQIEAASETGTSLVTNLLREIVSRVTKKQAEKAKETKSKKVSPFFDKRNKAIKTETREQRKNYVTGNPNARLIPSINIAFEKQKHPDSPFVKYYEKYGIEDALKAGTLKEDSKVYFITDDQLTQEYKEYLEQLKLGYTENELPIIAVIESESGPITMQVEGKDVHFLPVAIMANSSDPELVGSENMKNIRTSATNNTGISFIKNNDGTLMESQLAKPIVAKPTYDRSKTNKDSNNQVLDVIINDIPENQRNSLEAYNKAIDDFIDHLDTVTDPNTGRITLIYKLDKLNGDSQSIFIFTQPIYASKNAKGETITLVLLSVEGLINFNSRTRRAASALASIIESFTDEGMSFVDNKPTIETLERLNALTQDLNNKIGNFLSVPAKDGYSLTISPTGNISDGKRVFVISLQNSITKESIPLISFNKGITGTALENIKYNFLRNLISDNNGKIRMSTKQDSLVKWQVTYDEILKDKQGNEAARRNLKDIIADDILQVSASNVSLQYSIQGIILTDPTDKLQEEKPEDKPSPVVANSENASGPSSSDNINKGSTKIDPDFGTSEGKPEPRSNNTAENIKNIIDRILANSKKFNITLDERHYINTDTNSLYARVTDIITSTEYDIDKFDSNNPYVRPSTNIGNAMDIIVRDFFDGLIEYKDGVWVKNGNPLHIAYSNLNEQAVRDFMPKLVEFKADLVNKKQHVIPKGVTVSGKLEVADSEGKIRTIQVAGTLDLLTYDDQGNFYIYDMKTFHSDKDELKQLKWSLQLSLYKELFEKLYGVQVKGLSIIPIKVSYPDPRASNKYTVAGLYDSIGELLSEDNPSLLVGWGTYGSKTYYRNGLGIYLEFKYPLTDEGKKKIESFLQSKKIVGEADFEKILTEANTHSAVKPYLLMLNGKIFTSANPLLNDIMNVHYRPISLVYDKLDDASKAILSDVKAALETGSGVTEAPTTSTEPIDVRVPESGRPIIDISSGLQMKKPFENHTRSRSNSNEATNQLSPIPNLNGDPKLRYENLTRQQKVALRKRGIIKDTWDYMDDDSREKALECV